MERNLASVRKIDLIIPIPNADNIEKAIIGGWCTVVKKGEFKAGDLCVFVEIDTVLPKENPHFSFLESREYRVKPMTLRGVKSLGLCFSLSILPENIKIEENLNVANILGITRYEAPINYNISGDIKGVFPYFIPKTDSERVQNLIGVLNTYKDKPVVISEKLDGCSSTFYYKDGVFGVCSRNTEKKDTDNCIYWKVAKAYNLEKVLKDIDEGTNGGGVALQGEIIAPDIQQNKYKVAEPKLFVFDLYFINELRYANFYELLGICKLIKGLELVPSITILNNLESIINLKYDTYSFETGHKLLDNLIEFSKGKSNINPKIEREGVVIKPLEEILNVDKIGRFNFKVINPDFKD